MNSLIDDGSTGGQLCNQTTSPTGNLASTDERRDVGHMTGSGLRVDNSGESPKIKMNRESASETAKTGEFPLPRRKQHDQRDPMFPEIVSNRSSITLNNGTGASKLLQNGTDMARRP